MFRPMPLVTIRTPLRPTEDPEKVRTAILNIFPESEITVESDEIDRQDRLAGAFHDAHPEPSDTGFHP